MNNLSFRVLILFLLILTNCPAPLDGDLYSIEPDLKPNGSAKTLPPINSSFFQDKEIYGSVAITVKYNCNVNPNNLNSYDYLNNPIFLFEMPNFDVYNIKSLHFRDENLVLNRENYDFYDSGYRYEILNTHLIQITFYNNNGDKKLKRFPKDLKITTDNYYKFIVNNVFYDTNNFFRLEKDLKECQELIDQKKEKQEQPANRLRHFFKVDMK